MDEITGKKAGHRSENTITRETQRTQVRGRNKWETVRTQFRKDDKIWERERGQRSVNMINWETHRTKVSGRKNLGDLKHRC